MWIYANPNPKRRIAPDCVIRAVCIALDKTWYETSDELYATARDECSVTVDDKVWGKYLFRLGFIPFILPESCPKCVTVRAFSEIFRKGIFIIGTGYHAVTVIDGDYYDTWDSGDEVPTFFWKIL